MESTVEGVPEVLWRYWGIVTFMQDNPGLYGMDAKRAECHKELAAHYGFTHEESKAVTSRMDRFMDPQDPGGFHRSLVDLKK
jgi:hypothetical protein